VQVRLLFVFEKQLRRGELTTTKSAAQVGVVEPLAFGEGNDGSGRRGRVRG
jgi:hypothetical protein